MSSTSPEAALIAGLIQSPSAYAPTINMEKAIARRNIVLLMMLENRAIDRPAYDRAKRARVRLENRLRRDEPYGLYFKEAVRRELVDRFGWQRVSEGGLKVFTTIAPELQRQAEAIVERRLAEIERRRGYPHTARAKMTIDEAVAPPYLQAAVVVMDPKTGAVRAQVGRPELRREPVQSGGAGAPAVRIGVQADRLRRGDRAGAVAGLAGDQPERSDQHAVG